MKKKNDVLFLCQFFYPEYISSATLPYDTAIALKEAGYEVGVLCGYPNEYTLTNKVPLIETYNDLKIKRLKYVQTKRNSFTGRIINYFSFTFVVLLRFLELRNYKSIIVYSNPPILPLLAALAGKIFKSKVIFVSYDIYPEIAEHTKVISKNSSISKLMKLVNNIVYKNLYKVVALSTEMKDFLLKNRPNLRESQVSIIPNWYEDKGALTKKTLSKNSRFKLLKDKFVVSYLGNMGTAQDMDTIIQSMIELKNRKDIHYLFAGHGNKMDLLQATIQKEKIKNVTVVDFLHDEEYQDALKVSDCYIVSLAEGLTGLAVPSKTYSYMMSAKPVVAIIGEKSDIARDLQDNEAGYTIQNGEVLNLVNVLEKLQSDEGNLQKMGENCREVYLEKYTKTICTNKYINLIKEVLGD